MQVHMKNLNKNLNQKKNTNLIWTEIQKEMKSKFGLEIYESWLKKIYFEEQQSNYLVVSVATRFLRDWIVSRYLDEILKIVKKQIKEISRIEFRIEDKEHEKDKTVNNIIKKDDNISFLKDSFLQYNTIDQNKSFDNFFSNKHLVFTFSLSELSRDEDKYLAKTKGAKILSSISKKTDFLIAGEKAGSKINKATQLGIKILNEKDFLEKINL